MLLLTVKLNVAFDDYNDAPVHGWDTGEPFYIESQGGEKGDNAGYDGYFLHQLADASGVQTSTRVHFWSC